jgi:KipI family sensor histidine kinase inhibitor
MKKRAGDKPVIRLAGDSGLIIEFGQGIDPDVNTKVRAMAGALKADTPPGTMEIIPTYCSLLLLYDPLLTHPEKLVSAIERVEDTLDDTDAEPCKLVKIPVCYGGEFGPDIENVGKSAELCKEDVIRLHSEPEYLIMIITVNSYFMSFRCYIPYQFWIMLCDLTKHKKSSRNIFLFKKINTV